MARDRVERRRRGGYRGPAELWVGDEKRADVTVNLVGYVDVTIAGTAAGTEEVEDLKSWDGVVHGLDHATAFGLVGEMFRLRTPDGREGDAILRETSTGALQGSGEPPFDI